MRADVLEQEIAKRLEPVSDCARFEARCLLEHYAHISLSDIYLQKEVEPHTAAIETAVQKRLSGIPLQYILGKWEFMGNAFFVDENVLIPRPETELLCECLLDKIGQESIIYDLCAGSGCIAVSVAKLTGATVYAVEKYPHTMEVLKKNIALHNLESVIPVLSDITEAPPRQLSQADVILSNPPYIERRILPSLQTEVQKEPVAALDGGEDGLNFYRAIAANYVPMLKEGGYLAVEIGEGQAAAVQTVFEMLQHTQTIADYNGIDRVMVFRKEQI